MTKKVITVKDLIEILEKIEDKNKVVEIPSDRVFTGSEAVTEVIESKDSIFIC